MSKTEWGIKRLCATCAVPFYDLHRYPIRCPKCDAVFRPAAPTARRAAAKRPAPSKRGWPKTAPNEDRVPVPSAGSPPQRATDVDEDDEDKLDQDDEDEVLVRDDDDEESAEDIAEIEEGAKSD